MNQEIIVALLSPILPTIVLVLGGQILINRYAITQKSKEQEIELMRSIREKQYESIQILYRLFATFMGLYRNINQLDLTDTKERGRLLQEAITAESEVDALILRIGCEFSYGSDPNLSTMLGHLRQAVQLWRESLIQEKRLPFSSSNQHDYIRFKASFAATGAFLISHIYTHFGPIDIHMDDAKRLLTDAFDNRFEYESYHRSR